MGTGVSPALWPPATSSWCHQLSRPAVSCKPTWVWREREGAIGTAVSQTSRTGFHPEQPGAEEPVKPHGPLVRLGFTSHPASTCRLSTWSSPTALQRSCDLGVFILRWASHLDAFSGYPFPTSLPGNAPGGTTGTQEVSPSRSSRTRDGSSQHSNAHDGYRPNCLTTF